MVNYMMKKGATFCIIILLFAGLTIPQTLGSIIDASQSEQVEVYFWDLTGVKPEKKVLEFTDYQWYNLKSQLQEIRAYSPTIEESFNTQFALFKQYGLISYDMTYQDLQEKANKAFVERSYIPRMNPLPDSFIINAICAIDFELNNGTTIVFGLNTFMNVVGFDIISFHKGFTNGGIHTKGLLDKSVGSGTYLGSMFGLLGYWMGTKTGVGTYSELTVAGFTVLTAWFPVAS